MANSPNCSERGIPGHRHQATNQGKRFLTLRHTQRRQQPTQKAVTVGILITIPSSTIILNERFLGWPLWEGAKGQALSSGKSNWADGPNKVTAHSTRGHRLTKGVQELKVSWSQVTYNGGSWIFIAGSLYPAPSIDVNQSTFIII